MLSRVWPWASLVSILLVALAFDLYCTRRRLGANHALTAASAVRWSAAWVVLGLGFGVLVLALYDKNAALGYWSAYVVEMSLTLDSMIMFAWIFSELRLPARLHHVVLLTGIPVTLLVRAVLVAAGVLLLGQGHWITYPIAVLMALAALRMLLRHDGQEMIVRTACGAGGSWLTRIVPHIPVLDGARFWTGEGGMRGATPLLVALLVSEASDAVFATDSIIAVVSITKEPFVVYASNVFVMVALRSSYSVLHRAMARLRYLRPGLAVTLLVVSARLLIGEWLRVPTWAFVGAIASIVVASSAASIWRATPRPAEDRASRLHPRPGGSRCPGGPSSVQLRGATSFKSAVASER
jgi:tellurite resistance protein TerC